MRSRGALAVACESVSLIWQCHSLIRIGDINQACRGKCACASASRDKPVGLFGLWQSNALKPFKIKWPHYNFHSGIKELKTLFQNTNQRMTLLLLPNR